MIGHALAQPLILVAHRGGKDAETDPYAHQILEARTGHEELGARRADRPVSFIA